MDPLIILLIVVAVLVVAIATAVVLFLKEKREIEAAASERADELIEQGMKRNSSIVVEEISPADNSYEDAA